MSESKEETRIRLVVLVSEDPSDLYFANAIVSQFEVELIVVETQRASERTAWQKVRYYVGRPAAFWGRLFEFVAESSWRRSSDARNPELQPDFGDGGRRLSAAPGCRVIWTEGAFRINDAEYVDRVREVAPDLVLVCGTSMLSEELTDIPRLGVLNLHGGLSQHYRGLFTTDWAIHDDAPELVGATVHFVSRGIDDGAIVYQGRPYIEEWDNPSILYEKVVQLGIRMMSQAVRDAANGQLTGDEPQTLGKLCLRRDFTFSVEDKAWKRWRDGTVSRYLENKDLRDQGVANGLVNAFERPEDPWSQRA